MLYRKISTIINDYFDNNDEKILCIDGARQVGKSFIIRELGKKRYSNYIELNMADDFNGDKLYEKVGTIKDFYIQVSLTHGDKLDSLDNTLIFIDEIQIYPHLLTLLKPLRRDNKYKYICSGSELGLALSDTTLIPMGSIKEIKMYPLDFEEFLLANNVGRDVISLMKDSYKDKKSLNESLHKEILKYFKYYLFIGGLPDAVNTFKETNNIYKVRKIHEATYNYYKSDVSKYDKNNKLKIKALYDFIPSNIENKVKRVVFKEIEDLDDVRYSKYVDAFDYLLSSRIVLDSRAISDIKFPLLQSTNKNLIKLYLNDVGLFTNILYKTNLNAVLDDQSGINLGAVYETVVAQELIAHNHKLYYYDRKKVGEVDFLIDDYDSLSVIPIEIKSGKDINSFRALPKLIEQNKKLIKEGYVFSNNREVKTKDNITYLPIYFISFL